MIAFVVLALAVSIAVMIWQSRGAPPEHTDTGLGEPMSAATPVTKL
ncbi:hypothetical protein [Nocardioides sp. YIM 152315]|nr:hypothetical protein [Nocardioides sp. YIM 152315]MDF1602870.1 hypothetical protein [Nocardioides sp. YIM 152315]